MVRGRRGGDEPGKSGQSPGKDRSREVSSISMQVDLRVHDDVALGEMELFDEVLATVAASDGPLSKRELDEVLGIRRDERQRITVSVYLDTEDGHEAVEEAVAVTLESIGFEIKRAYEPVVASWFRKFVASAKEMIDTPEVEKRLMKMERAIEIRLLLADQAKIDSAQSDAVSKLLTALADTQNALIQIGSVLLIKIDGVPVVRNLSQYELAYLESHPALLRNPANALQQLQEIDRDEAI